MQHGQGSVPWCSSSGGDRVPGEIAEPAFAVWCLVFAVIGDFPLWRVAVLDLQGPPAGVRGWWGAFARAGLHGASGFAADSAVRPFEARPGGATAGVLSVVSVAVLVSCLSCGGSAWFCIRAPYDMLLGRVRVVAGAAGLWRRFLLFRSTVGFASVSRVQ